ncbi:uncharacterized protein LOC126737902 [Anthonomus grandis grandis]|uniref:uncharacterized protein LOC126737902 n=1 Tax=Anthonomus grandis grandis TaxID=2921223 RepID=UPI00216580EA|nr:uncharacterized protein LOC126737902 [Anthonomus grandis grandis]
MDPNLECRIHNLLHEIRCENTESYEIYINPNKFTSNGYASEFYRCELTNKDNGEVTHILVKVVPRNLSRCSMVPNFQNEICFYKRVYPELKKFQENKRVSKLFTNLPRFIAGTCTYQKEIILVENLFEAKYRITPRQLKLTPMHMKNIFQTYARFHALSYMYRKEHYKTFKELIKELGDLSEYNPKCTLRGNAFKSALDVLDPENDADIIKVLNKLDLQNIKEEAQREKGNFTCLIHGDSRVGNMLFKKNVDIEEQTIKLIDFQRIAEKSAVVDLSYFFYAEASKEDLDNLDQYLKIYYNYFSNFAEDLGAKAPEDIPPFEALREEWKKCCMPNLILGIFMWPDMLKEKREILGLVESNHITRERGLQLWNEKVTNTWKSDEFRTRVRDVAGHAIQYGILEP